MWKYVTYCARLAKSTLLRKLREFVEINAFVGDGYLKGAFLLSKVASKRSSFAPNAGFVVLTAWALDSFEPGFREPKASWVFPLTRTNVSSNNGLTAVFFENDC